MSLQIENIEKLLLLLTEDLSKVDQSLESNLINRENLDLLVDIDILKDYKSKLVADSITLNEEIKSEFSGSSVKRKLHNLMCLYSEYVDRSNEIFSNYTNLNYKEIEALLNMNSINNVLFQVLRELTHKEKGEEKSTNKSNTYGGLGIDPNNLMLK